MLWCDVSSVLVMGALRCASSDNVEHGSSSSRYSHHPSNMLLVIPMLTEILVLWGNWDSWVIAF